MFSALHGTDGEQMEGTCRVEMPELALLPYFPTLPEIFGKPLTFCGSSNETCGCCSTRSPGRWDKLVQRGRRAAGQLRQMLKRFHRIPESSRLEETSEIFQALSTKLPLCALCGDTRLRGTALF